MDVAEFKTRWIRDEGSFVPRPDQEVEEPAERPPLRFAPPSDRLSLRNLPARGRSFTEQAADSVQQDRRRLGRVIVVRVASVALLFAAALAGLTVFYTYLPKYAAEHMGWSETAKP
jgi:hypothetical protein